jgi:glycosyltransferase involved in cell wall biosynthesis
VWRDVKALKDPVRQVRGNGANGAALRVSHLPLVSLIVPAHNEAAVAERNLAALCAYMQTLEERFRWELIAIDDGSSDGTRAALERFAQDRDNVTVLRHRKNFGLGQALKFGINRSRGDYVVTLDMDLSYSPDHIALLLDKMIATHARVVVASPYMRGGRISEIPWPRRILSVWANRFLSATAEGNLATLTGMVRAYDGRFIRSLNLRATGAEVNSKIIHQAQILNARVEEVPAHLDWRRLVTERKHRRSSLKLLRHATAVILSGFLFRPVVFFIAPGLALLGLSLYAGVWAAIHTVEQYRLLTVAGDYDITNAVAAAFRAAPHTFVIGGVALMVAIQLIGLGILSLQSKHYFEEMFFMGASLQRAMRRREDDVR